MDAKGGIDNIAFINPHPRCPDRVMMLPPIRGNILINLIVSLTIRTWRDLLTKIRLKSLSREYITRQPKGAALNLLIFVRFKKIMDNMGGA